MPRIGKASRAPVCTVYYTVQSRLELCAFEQSERDNLKERKLSVGNEKGRCKGGSIKKEKRRVPIHDLYRRCGNGSEEVQGMEHC